jgi:hypothetical protein
MTRLQKLAREFADARDKSADLRKQLAVERAKLAELRPQIAEAIVDEARAGRRQTDIVRDSGYTRERVRQICRAAGVEPPDE